MKPPLALFEELSEWQSMSPGLERVERALEALDAPHESYPHILVGGTNGKGSVCINAAAGLKGKVGVFLSPHVYDLRERILIDGAWCSDACWRSAYQFAMAHAPEAVRDLSYFEWTLILATLMFREAGVSRAVFEVGLGGRTDATNALNPELSAITNVSLDHTQLLGDTVAQIALEKLAIGRPNKPFLIPKDVASYSGVPDFLNERGLTPQLFDNKGLLSDNFALAKRIVHTLQGETPEWLEVLLPGRKEFVNIGEGIYLDGAHNVSAWDRLFEWAKITFDKNVSVVGCLSEGRNPEEFVHSFMGVKGTVMYFHHNGERVLSPANWPSWVQNIQSVDPASLLDRPLLVCGSLYMLGPFKKWMAQWDR